MDFTLAVSQPVRNNEPTEMLKISDIGSTNISHYYYLPAF